MNGHDASAGGASSTTGLEVLPVSTQHWRGTNDVLLDIGDRSGTSLAERDLSPTLVFTGPDASRVEAVPAVERFATYGRRLYRARVPLHAEGRWSVLAVSRIDGVDVGGAATIEVWPDMGTPALGSPAPGGRTPTMRDAQSNLHRISSDPEPLSAFYIWSVDDALAHGQPLAFIMDSYAFRPNSACGGALGILHEVFIDYPALTIVHAEPWHMRHGEDGITLDPPGGPAVLTDFARAWGIEEPPWVFVVASDGRLHAKFTGIIGSDELRAALASVAPWRPVG